MDELLEWHIVLNPNVLTNVDQEPTVTLFLRNDMVNRGRPGNYPDCMLKGHDSQQHPPSKWGPRDCQDGNV